MSKNKISRRDFGRQMIAASAAVGLLSGLPLACSKGDKKIPVGLQLYTVRELSRDDFKGTVKKVAELGYRAVEFAGYGGLSGKEVRELIDSLGLKCCGTHEGYGRLTNQFEETINMNLAIDSPYVICPSMPRELREKGAEGIKAFADEMNKIGAKVVQAGLGLAYHNHSFEFKKEGEKYLYDILVEETDPELVKLEIDTYWVQYAGLDPIDLIRKLSKRCALLHMKDMTEKEPKTFAPIGTGIMDMAGIVKAGKEVATEWYVVEQDRTQRPVMEAIEISVKNLDMLLNG